MAQRVMDCGDAGHILLSKHVADDLEQYRSLAFHLHDLGECEVKHDVRVPVVNLYTEELGNPEVPQKIRAGKGEASSATGFEQRRPRLGHRSRWIHCRADYRCALSLSRRILHLRVGTRAPTRHAHPAPQQLLFPKRRSRCFPLKT